MTAGSHDDARLIFSLFHHFCVTVGTRIDGKGIVVAVSMLIRRQRYRDPVILRLPKGFPLALSHANDRVGNSINAQFLADWISVAENVVDDVVAHDRAVRGMLNVGV